MTDKDIVRTTRTDRLPDGRTVECVWQTVVNVETWEPAVDPMWTVDVHLAINGEMQTVPTRVKFRAPIPPDYLP